MRYRVDLVTANDIVSYWTDSLPDGEAITALGVYLFVIVLTLEY